MKQILTILAVCALLVATVSAAEAAGKPNIVYILCDDIGCGDVKCLCRERGKIPTPNIDRLAEQGMTFPEEAA